MYRTYMSPLKAIVDKVTAGDVYRLELENQPVIDPGIRVVTYVCNNCSRLYYPDELYAKKISFLPMQPGAQRTRSRTLGNLCIECAEADPDWKLPAHRRANRVVFKPEGHNA